MYFSMYLHLYFSMYFRMYFCMYFFMYLQFDLYLYSFLYFVFLPPYIYFYHLGQDATACSSGYAGNTNACQIQIFIYI